MDDTAPVLEPISRVDRIGRKRPVRTFRIWVLMLVIAVVAVGLGVIRDPILGPLVNATLVALEIVIMVLVVAIGGAVALMVVAMIPGWFGFVLFALWDRVWARTRGVERRDESERSGP